MQLTTNKGMALLGLWLVLTGIAPFLSVQIPYRAIAMPLLALVAGVMLLLGR